SYLIGEETTHREVPRIGVREVQTGDRRGGRHREAFGQRDAVVRRVVEQREQRALRRVIRAGGVAERRANAAVLLGDDVAEAERLAAAVAPLDARAVMQ